MSGVNCLCGESLQLSRLEPRLLAMATRRSGSEGSLSQNGAAVAKRHGLPYPESVPGKRLVEFSKVAVSTGAVFEEAQRNRDAHQRRLNEMVEETLRLIHRARLLIQQKSKHVQATTSSYGAKFEHSLSCVREELLLDFEGRASRLEGTLDGLELGVRELEGDLKAQIVVRKTEIEKTLGPIRDEVARLTAALEDERRTRRRCEEDRDKMLADEVEAFTKLIDEEKHDREQQLMEFKVVSEREFQRMEKRQIQAEIGTKHVAEAQRHELKHAAKERIACQHGIIASIASFIKRYREELARDVGD